MIRLPFRRRPKRSSTAGVAGADARPAGRAWAELPPLPLTVPRTVPVTAPSAALAEATRRRVAPATGGVPLTHRIPVDPVRGLATGIAWPSAPAASAGAGTSAAGDLTGVVARVPAVAAARAGDLEAAPVAPQRRVVGVADDAVSRPAAVPLTRVDRESVDGVAHRAGLRHPRPRVESPSGLGDDDTADPGDEPSPAARDEEPGAATGPAHRANLGRSRRLGLGPPLRDASPPRAESAAPADVVENVDADGAGPRPMPLPDLRHAPRERAISTTDEVTRSAPASAVPEVEPVPGGLARDLAPILRTDIGDAVVHRGEAAQRLAAQHRARAVTAAGEVYLPREQGGLDDRRTLGLLAHELTHVAQQRRHGDRLPTEDSLAGRRLEAEAQAVERHVRGDAAAPPPPPPSPPPPAATPAAPPAAHTPDSGTVPADVMDDLVRAGLAVRDADGAVRFRLTAPPETTSEPPSRDGRTAPTTAEPAIAAPAPGRPAEPTIAAPAAGRAAAAAVQRASDDVVTAPTTDHSPPATADPPAPAPMTILFQIPAEAPASRAGGTAPVDPVPSAGAVAATSGSAGPVAGAAAVATGGAAASSGTRPAPGDAAAPSAMEDIDLDDLSRRIYERLRRRLRSELLVDRERAGLATDLIR